MDEGSVYAAAAFAWGWGCPENATPQQRNRVNVQRSERSDSPQGRIFHGGRTRATENHGERIACAVHQPDRPSAFLRSHRPFTRLPRTPQALRLCTSSRIRLPLALNPLMPARNACSSRFRRSNVFHPSPFSLRMRLTTADTFMVTKRRTGLVVSNQRLDVAAKPSWPPDLGSDPRLSGTGHSHVMCGWPPIGKGSFALRHVQPLAVMAGLTRPSGPALRPAQARHHLGRSDCDGFRVGR